MWNARHRLLSFWPPHRRKAAVDIVPLHQLLHPAVVETGSVRMNGSPLICGPPPVRTIHLVNGKAKRLAESHDRGYQAAVNQLNQLQSNALVLRSHQGTERKRFLDTWKYCQGSGLSREDLDRLPVIHVAGTKGKGSVCSFVDSILREHGLRTGFFSSPHLVSVTERIRLNGAPISQEYFARSFWDLFQRLNSTKEAPDDLPPYFKFLTLMAFNVFLAERVDVAIVEVGVGGEYDCTNIIRNTRTVGITSLGLDHVNVLGDTIEKIAWQKAGIIKENSNVFTVEQPEGAQKVIQERTEEKQANLRIVPAFEEYTWSRQPNFNVSNTSVHKLNISLAIQLSLDWLVHLGQLPENCNRVHCTEQMIAGIEKFHWPGRYEIIDQGARRFFIDGAHTLESIVACLDWFEKTSSGGSKKTLIFYVTGTRDVESLARPIIDRNLFDVILISPNVVDSQATIVDNVVHHSNSNEVLHKCHEIREKFLKITTSSRNSVSIEVVASVKEALRRVDGTGQHEVLITGSLYLVGTALIALNQCSPSVE